MIFLILFNPSETEIFPPCPFFWMTGLYCPGCGSLRAVHELFHGNFISALSLNPLLIISLPLIAVYTCLKTYHKKIKFNAFTLNLQFYYVIILIILLYWLLRNIPSYPFIFLSPN